MLLTERALRRIIKRVLVEKSFSDIPGYDVGAEVDVHEYLSDPDYGELRDEIIALINQAYAYMGTKDKPGKNYDYSEPGHLIGNDLNWAYAWDIDGDEDPDVFRGGKNKGGSKKLTVSGNDGSLASTSYSKEDTCARLSAGDHFAEMSGRSAGANMKAGVPAITDEETAMCRMAGKEITWYGEHPDKNSVEYLKSKQYADRNPMSGNYDGWYMRNVSGHQTFKMLFGQ